MLPEQKIEISKARLDHAKECLQDAKLLLADKSYHHAVNSAYNTIFHAMRAVLALDGVDANCHNGVISEFRKRYLQPGIFDASLSWIIFTLSSVREGSDCSNSFVASKAETVQKVQAAEEFLTEIQTYLSTQY